VNVACPELTALARLSSGLWEESDERAALAAHVETCAACRDRSSRLTAALAFPAEVQPPAHVLPALLREVGERLTKAARGKEGSAMEHPQQQDDEPVALLGGAVGVKEEELPALPPASAAPLSVSDLLPAQTAAQETWDVKIPPPPPGIETVNEPLLPKTITQEDAEDIIRRITSRALPEIERAPEPIRLTPRPRRSSAPLVALAATVLLGFLAAAAYESREDLAPYLPEWLAAELGFDPTPPPVVAIETPRPQTREQILEKKLRAKVLQSEWLAFGYASQEEFERDMGGAK
jgi:hypothetical protein